MPYRVQYDESKLPAEKKKMSLWQKLKCAFGNHVWAIECTPKKAFKRKGTDQYVHVVAFEDAYVYCSRCEQDIKYPGGVRLDKKTDYCVSPLSVVQSIQVMNAWLDFMTSRGYVDRFSSRAYGVDTNIAMMAGNEV